MALEMDEQSDRPPEYITSAETLSALVGLSTVTARKLAEGKMLALAERKRCKTHIKDLLKSVRQEHVQALREKNAHVTEFSTLPENIGEQLKCGKYKADDTGVVCIDYTGLDATPTETRVCYHPIIPSEFFENVEDGNHRVRIAFYQDGRWKSTVVDRSMIATRQSITGLSQYGVNVTSETARHLVQYLADVEAQNETRIPRNRSIGRLGWIGDEFAPYMSAIRYDGGDEYRDLFDSVREHGDFDIWRDHVVQVRKRDSHARLLLAASFAAPIVGRLKGLSFFVHLWGASGTGKTVAEMLAASVWGDPSAGKIMRTLNSTSNYIEYFAAFMHNLPICLNELQTLKNKNELDSLIYMLGEGQGKGRARRSGGTRAAGKWGTIVITNGEQPLTTYQSGAGAINRVIDLPCFDPLFDDPRGTVDIIRDNHGHAGKLFIERLKNLPIDELREMYNTAVTSLKAISNSSDKLALNAAYLVLADDLATEWIFQDGRAVTAADFDGQLAEPEDIDGFARALEWVKSWVATNRYRFDDGRPDIEIWGRLMQDKGSIAIVSSVLAQKMIDADLSYEAFLAGAERRGLIRTGAGKRTVAVRISNTPVRCVVLKLSSDEAEQIGIPF